MGVVTSFLCGLAGSVIGLDGCGAGTLGRGATGATRCGVVFLGSGLMVGDGDGLTAGLGDVGLAGLTGVGLGLACAGGVVAR